MKISGSAGKAVIKPSNKKTKSQVKKFTKKRVNPKDGKSLGKARSKGPGLGAGQLGRLGRALQNIATNQVGTRPAGADKYELFRGPKFF